MFLLLCRAFHVAFTHSLGLWLSSVENTKHSSKAYKCTTITRYFTEHNVSAIPTCLSFDPEVQILACLQHYMVSERILLTCWPAQDR